MRRPKTTAGLRQTTLRGSYTSNNNSGETVLLLLLPQVARHPLALDVVVATTEVPQRRVIITPLMVTEDVAIAVNAVTTGATVNAVVVVTSVTAVVATTGTALNISSNVATPKGGGMGLWPP